MIPYIKGTVTNQAHVNIPDGVYEEEIGRNGFFGKYAHLYRTHAPVGWTRIEGDLKPRSFDLNKLSSSSSNITKDSKIDYMQSRKSMLFNDDVSIEYAQLQEPMKFFFRNADADEVLFCHKGTGRIETDFGPLEYEEGDYLNIPRGTVYRLDVSTPTDFLIVQSYSEVQLPDKGMLGQHALFDPAVVKVPTPEVTLASSSNLHPDKAQNSQNRTNSKESQNLINAQGEYELQIKRCGQISKVFYPFNPIDVIGWKGTLTAWKINMRDIRPISCDRYHLPPSAHTTFVAHNFVICSFLPRPLENGDPGAMKVPFYHSNIDFDEVIFYHKGEFFSRTGVGEGMMTFHPQGIHHGPQEGAVTRTAKATHTNEMAVMIDTKRPLQVAKDIHSVENVDYWKSWQAK